MGSRPRGLPLMRVRKTATLKKSRRSSQPNYNSINMVKFTGTASKLQFNPRPNRSTRRKWAKLKTLPAIRGLAPRKEAPITKTLKNLFQDYFKNFNAPPDFQRPRSWDADNEYNFFVSLLENTVEGTIVLVDILEALEAVKNIVGNTTKGVKDMDRLYATISLLEEKLKEGYDYIVLDGNNRLCFYIDLFNNEYSIPDGTYYYVPHNGFDFRTFIVSRKANKFKDLPPDVQKALWHRLQTVSVYTQVDWDRMCEIFLNVNDGVDVERQEKRNAFGWSDWAGFIRTLRSENLNLLKMIHKDPIKAYTGDQTIAQCIDFVRQAIEETETIQKFENEIDADEDGKGIPYQAKVKVGASNQGTLDSLYCTVLEDEDKDYFQAQFLNLSHYVSTLCDEALNEKEKEHYKSKAFIMNLFFMMCNGLDTYQEVSIAANLHRERVKDTSQTFAADKKTFYNACSGTSKPCLEYRYIVLTEIISKVHDQLGYSEELEETFSV